MTTFTSTTIGLMITGFSDLNVNPSQSSLFSMRMMKQRKKQRLSSVKLKGMGQCSKFRGSQMREKLMEMANNKVMDQKEAFSSNRASYKWSTACCNVRKMIDQSLVHTLDEALSALGFGNFQVLVLAYAGLGWVAEAMEMMLLSFVGPAIQPEWGLTSNQESLISTIAFAGMLVGAYSWGIVSDIYGRKKGFLFAAILTTVAGFLSAFSPNYVTLLILRCITGIGLGSGHVYTSWFLEFVPTPNRGLWMVVFSSFWTVGTIFEASLAWIIMPISGWRWLLAMSSFPSLIVLLFYGFVPESPRYLCMKGRTNEARIILEKGAFLNQKDLPPGMLVSDQMMKSNDELEPLEDSQLLSTEKKEYPDLETSSSSTLGLFSPKLIKTTLLLWFLFFGNTFSYYGVILLTSQLSSGHGMCGSLPVQASNHQDSSLYIDVFITSLAEVPGLILSAFIVDKVGRKLSMEIMFFLGFILLLPLVFHQSEFITTSLLFGARMFVSATFTVACIYAPEVYPTNLRATGVGIATAMGRIGGMVCPLVAVGLVSGCHQTAAVIVFEVMIVLSMISVVFFPFETKGKELVDSVHESD